MSKARVFLGKFLATLLRPVRPLARLMILVILLIILTLGSTGHLEPVKKVLDSPVLTLQIQNFIITPYRVLQIALVFVSLSWVASLLSDWVAEALRHFKNLKSGDIALFAQISRIAIYVVLFLLGLNILGLSLGSLTIFSGAVGIGVGFGLQKIASNFISGLIITAIRAFPPA